MPQRQLLCGRRRFVHELCGRDLPSSNQYAKLRSVQRWYIIGCDWSVGFDGLRQLRCWNLLSKWGIVVHELCGGHIPGQHGDLELLFVSRRKLLGRGRHCVHELRCGNLPNRRRRFGVCQLRSRYLLRWRSITLLELRSRHVRDEHRDVTVLQLRCRHLFRGRGTIMH